MDGVWTAAAWWQSWAKGKLFRVWDKDADPGCPCDFCFIDQVVDTGTDLLLGLSSYDERYDDLRYPDSLDFRLLSEIRLTWYKTDMEEIGNE